MEICNSRKESRERLEQTVGNCSAKRTECCRGGIALLFISKVEVFFFSSGVGSGEDTTLYTL